MLNTLVIQCIQFSDLNAGCTKIGYTKIILGTSAFGRACHVLSATVKGQGYFLPIDVQYVDTRWDVPVFLPLHDSLSQELSLLCKLDSVVNLHLSIKFSHGSK